MPKKLWLVSPILSVCIAIYTGSFIFLSNQNLHQIDFHAISKTTKSVKETLITETESLKKQVSLATDSVNQAKSDLQSLSRIRTLSFGEEPPIEELYIEIERRDRAIKSQVKVAEEKLNIFSKELNKSKEQAAQIENSINDKLSYIENKVKELETKNVCPETSSIPFWALIVAILAMLPSWIQLILKKE